MNDIILKIAEAKIREAIQKGELNNLPGEGKPLTLEENTFVPEELRGFYRIMKNSGLVPVEVAIQKEIELLRELIKKEQDPKDKIVLKKRLNELTIHYNVIMEKRHKKK